jgi:hypothetical protein
MHIGARSFITLLHTLYLNDGDKPKGLVRPIMPASAGPHFRMHFSSPESGDNSVDRGVLISQTLPLEPNAHFLGTV